MSDVRKIGACAQQEDQAEADQIRRRVMDKPDMLKAALDYVEKEYKIFPCSGKAPLTPNGFKDASSDPDQIRKWWKKWSNANIGVPCDHENGFWALDVDAKSGGLESLENLEREHGKLTTHKVLTGGGGYHFRYRYPQDAAIITKRIGKGLEIRADGAYIIVPPSLHKSGKRYIASEQDEVEDPPEWIVKLVSEPKGKRTPNEPITTKIYEHEGRNEACTREAGRLLNIYKDPEVVKPMVWAYNQTVNVPPLSDEECTKTWEKSLAKWAEKESEPDEYVPLRSMAEVEPKDVGWLWYPYIPLGKLTLLEGDPGEGKSWASQAIASMVSLGELESDPASVLLASIEDDLDDTIRPRLEAMKADLGLIRPIEVPFILDDKGFALLETYMEEYHPLLFIIDPLVGFLGAKVDMHRANEVRVVMAKLAALAKNHNCAILLIRHLNKGGSAKVLYRGMGSIDFTAAVRSILLAGHEGNNLSERALVHIKCNVAPLGESIGFMLGDVFCWTGQSTLTADRILEVEGRTPKLTEAIDFLGDTMVGGEPILAIDIFKAAKEEGISERTLKRAKSRLHIKSGKESGVWYWYLGEKTERFDQYADNKILLYWPHIKLAGDQVWVTPEQKG